MRLNPIYDLPKFNMDEITTYIQHLHIVHLCLNHFLSIFIRFAQIWSWTTFNDVVDGSAISIVCSNTSTSTCLIIIIRIHLVFLTKMYHDSLRIVHNLINECQLNRIQFIVLYLFRIYRVPSSRVTYSWLYVFNEFTTCRIRFERKYLEEIFVIFLHLPVLRRRPQYFQIDIHSVFTNFRIRQS